MPAERELAAGIDALDGADWYAVSTPAGAVCRPDELPDDDEWLPAVVPGTVASALVAAGLPAESSLDSFDWWFRVRFAVSETGSFELRFNGLATHAEIWLDGVPAGTSDSMFVPLVLTVDLIAGTHLLQIRFRSLEAELGGRRPRPRWRVARLKDQNLRWVRTSLLGRLRGVVEVPPPVGPWRPVSLYARTGGRIVASELRVRCDGADGVVEIWLSIDGDRDPGLIQFEVGTVGVVVRPSREHDYWRVHAAVRIDAVERWWPRTHGNQPLYLVRATFDETTTNLGRVGFRTVAADTSGDGFQLVVNDVPIFVRGACWTPFDPVGFDSPPTALAEILQLAADSNLNLIRVTGDTVYESDHFYDLCDELGLLVWQDVMLAFCDPPETQDWTALLEAEVVFNLGRLRGRPSLAVVSGGTEIAQQMLYGAAPSNTPLNVLTKILPEIVGRTLGDVPYVPTTPWGGDIATRPDTGIAHYYGVGAYLRALDDARMSGVRFAAECLAFAIPPSQETVEEAFGSARAAGHHPEWKRAVFRDAGASWDFEDVTTDYVARVAPGLDPLRIRYTDPERWLDLCRATLAHVYTHTFAEWRRSKSSSSGGIIFQLRDHRPGAGLGLIDAFGRPKAPLTALAAVLAPIAITVSDEGLNGLEAHVHNDTNRDLDGALAVGLHLLNGVLSEKASVEVRVPARSSVAVGVDGLFGGFRDLTWSHRFGPRVFSRARLTLCDSDGSVRASCVADLSSLDTVTVVEWPGLAKTRWAASETDGESP